MRRSWTSRLALPALADVVGLALVAVLAVWIGLFAGSGRGRPGPQVALLAAIVVTVGLGRLASRLGLGVHRAVGAVVIGAVVVTWPGALQAGGAPLGYANANATLTALGVIAAIGAARAAGSVEQRNRWLALGGCLAAATALTGSVAGILSLLAALVLLAVAAAARWPPAILGGASILLSATLAVTVAIALGGDPAGLGARTDVRGQLWTAAADIAADDPIRGIGPGEFAPQNPVSDDADLRWAHHGYLQVAAELGVVGLLLVLALIGWVIARLWIASTGGPVGSSLGGAALLVVGLHGAVDYVWHVPAVLLVLAALLGDATVAGRAGSTFRTRAVFITPTLSSGHGSDDP